MKIVVEVIPFNFLLQLLNRWIFIASKINSHIRQKIADLKRCLDQEHH